MLSRRARPATEAKDTKRGSVRLLHTHELAEATEVHEFDGERRPVPSE